MRNCLPFDGLPKAGQFGGLIYKFGLVADLPHTLPIVGQVITG